MNTSGFDIRLAESQDDYRAFTEIAREYIVSLGFEIDFQDVNLDMAEARRRYGKSGGGAALLAVAETGDVIGTAALRDLGEGVCELKRMYVESAHRNRGAGTRLCEESVAIAKRFGYRAMRLDTLERMAAATRLYEAKGFRRIEPYTSNPLPDALFYELDLDALPSVSLPSGLI